MESWWIPVGVYCSWQDAKAKTLVKRRRGPDMKALLVSISIGVLIGAASLAPAQQSPPATETVTIGGKTITINYSSPRVRGREGQLFGKEGRIGKDRTYPV